MNQIISIVQNFLKTVSLQPGGKILAAVSGGADSVAMLHILHQISTGDSYPFSDTPAAAASASEPISQSSIIHSTGDSHLFPDTLTAAASASEPISQSKIENRKSSILFCAHINHQLRDKESDADEQFTAELCKKLNIPFFVERINVKIYAAQKKLSIETAARQLRLDALVRIARCTGCQTIATAHHKDDQAETVLFRLLRGTAFAGLAGIRPVIERSGLRWIRPMLHIRRTDIESYCRQNNLSWRQDASNLQTYFRRNWIRHRLLPLMQQNSENDLTEKLAALAESALSLQQQVESAAAEISQSKIENGKLTISSSAVQQSGPFVAGEILRTVLNHLGRGLQDMSLSHYRRFFQLLDKNRAVLELPGGCIIRKKSDTLIFETVNSPKEPCFTPDVLKLSINNNQLSITQFGPWRIQSRRIRITQNDLITFQKLWESENVLNRDSHLFLDTPAAAASASEPNSQSKIENRKSSILFRQWFDLAQIQSPLIARDKQPKDEFVPFGRKTKKRISRFLTDSQIDPKQRESCFVIEDKTGVLWLAPVRRSACAAVGVNTVDVLEISITPEECV